MAEYESLFRDRAKEFLVHYFGFIAKGAGVKWDWENDQEVSSVVDNIVAAVKDELAHEKEGAK